MNEDDGGFMTFLSITIMTQVIFVLLYIVVQCTLILIDIKKKKFGNTVILCENDWISGIVFTPVRSVWFSSGEVGFI